MALDLEEKLMEYENILFSEENTDWIGLCWIKMIDGEGYAVQAATVLNSILCRISSEKCPSNTRLVYSSLQSKTCIKTAMTVLKYFMTGRGRPITVVIKVGQNLKWKPKKNSHPKILWCSHVLWSIKRERALAS